MSIHLGIYDGPTGALLLDATARGATNIRASTNQRGFERLDATIPMPLTEAYALWDGAKPWAVLRANGHVIFEGALADPELFAATAAGLVVRAYGTWDALADLPYTALWSDTRTRPWRELLTSINVAYVDQKYGFSQDSGLYWTPKRGQSFTNGGGSVSGWYYEIPSQSTRNITNISFDYQVLLPNNWVFRVGAWTAGFAAFTSEHTFTAVGALQSGTLCVPLASARPIVLVDTYNNTGVTYTNAQDDGAWYARITNVRVTTTPLLVDTVLTTTAASGDTAIIVASAANITPGLALILQTAGGALPAGERVQVASVAGTTITLTGPLFYSYSAGFNALRAQRVTAADIASDIVSAVSTLNPDQLSSSTAGILPAASLPDLSDQVYEDADIGDALTALALLGDASGGLLEVGVWEDRRLVLRARGSAARTWFPDVTGLRLRRAGGGMANSIYATYRDADGRTLRTAAATNSRSVLRHGFTRRRAVSVDTTSATEATRARDVTLADSAAPPAQGEYQIGAVEDGNGVRVPAWLVRAGDTATFRVVPSGLGASVDQVRTVRISRTDYDADADALAIEPEAPIPTLDVLLAQQQGVLNPTITPRGTFRNTKPITFLGE